MKLSIFVVIVGVFLCISFECVEGKKPQDDLEFLDDEGDFGSGQGGLKSRPEKRRNSPARIDDEDDGEGSGSGAGPVIKPQPPLRGPDRPQSRGPERPGPVVITTTTTTTTTTTEAPEEEEPEPEVDNEEDEEDVDDIDEEVEEEEYDDKDDEPEVFAPQPETPAPAVKPVVPDIIESSQEEEEEDEIEPDEPHETIDIGRENVFPGPDSGKKSSAEEPKNIDDDDDDEEGSDRGLVPVDPGRELPPVQTPPSDETPEEEPGKDVHIYDAKEDLPASFFAQPGILAAIVGGAVVGLLFAILVVMFIVYRMRKKDEGSYILDEKRSPTSNSYSKSSREFYA